MVGSFICKIILRGVVARWQSVSAAGFDAFEHPIVEKRIITVPAGYQVFQPSISPGLIRRYRVPASGFRHVFRSANISRMTASTRLSRSLRILRVITDKGLGVSCNILCSELCSEQLRLSLRSDLTLTPDLLYASACATTLSRLLISTRHDVTTLSRYWERFIGPRHPENAR